MDYLYEALKNLGVTNIVKYYPDNVERTYNELNIDIFTLDELKDEINRVELEYYKQQKIEELRNAKNNANSQGCIVNINETDYLFYSTKEDIYNYKDAIGLGILIQAPTIKLAIMNNHVIEIEPTQELIDNITKTIGLQLFNNWQKFKSLEFEVLQATTKEGIDAIIW